MSGASGRIIATGKGTLYIVWAFLSAARKVCPVGIMRHSGAQH
jgi:hypothetical protein